MKKNVSCFASTKIPSKNWNICTQHTPPFLPSMKPSLHPKSRPTTDDPNRRTKARICSQLPILPPPTVHVAHLLLRAMATRVRASNAIPVAKAAPPLVLPSCARWRPPGCRLPLPPPPTALTLVNKVTPPMVFVQKKYEPTPAFVSNYRLRVLRTVIF